MNKEQYDALLRRTGDDEPAHLRVIPEYTRLRLASERREAAQRQQSARDSDAILNRVWADYTARTIDGRDLQALVYGSLFFGLFRFWPGSIPVPLAERYGITTRHDKIEPTSASLARLHEKTWRFLIPAATAGDRRSDSESVFDYDPRCGHTFSEWIRRKSKNTGRDVDQRRYALELRSRQFEIQMRDAGEFEDEWSTYDGSVTTDVASNELPKPILTDEDFADTPVPLELRQRLGQLRRKFAEQHPYIAAHYLRGIWSAAEIERRLKEAGVTQKPSGRKAIARLLDLFEKQQHRIAIQFLREQGAYLPDDEAEDERKAQHVAKVELKAEAERLVRQWVASAAQAKTKRAEATV